MARAARKVKTSDGPPPRARLFKKQQKSNFRSIILAGCAGYFVQKTLQKQLLPWGPAESISEPTQYADIDFSNDLLQVQHGRLQKIFEKATAADGRLGAIHKMKGPETVVFGNDGAMYVMTEDAKLVVLKDLQPTDDAGIVNATAEIVHDLGVGRPLGGCMTPKDKSSNTLYIGDAVLGLTRLRDVKDPTSKIEIVASSVLDDGIETPIRYADDVVVGPKTGKVYFTDASDIAPDRILEYNTWDTLYASKIDLGRAKASGRLLQYDPSTDKTTILARGIHFANGISVNKDETYLMVAETFGVNLLKYDLAGGTIEIAVHGKDLPGYLDGVDCSWTTGKCYAVMPSAIVPLHKLWNRLPGPLSVFLRTVILLLPRALAPPVKKFGGIVEVNPVSNEFRLLLDPTGKDISMLTGVTEHDNKLYLGSLKNEYIGVYNLLE